MSRVKELLEEFPGEKITFRPGSTNVKNIKAPLDDTNAAKAKAIPLAYIDARDVMDRLDEIVGVESWKDEYEFHGNRTICKLSICIDGQWITKSDGAGDTNIEGEKGGLSDAFKRAAVKWGIGRYLYKLKFKWAPITKWKRFDDKLDLWNFLITKGTNKPSVQKVKAPEIKELPETPETLKDRLIIRISTFDESAQLTDWERNQNVIDARDKLFIASQHLSEKVDLAITEKQVSFIESPSKL